MKTRFLWRALKARYRDQIAELRVIKNRLRPGDTICDIGANKGSYLFWFSRWVGTGRVIAFEPQEKLADYLRSACSTLPLPNVVIEGKAVDGKSGSMTLYIPDGSGNSPEASLSPRVSDREACRKVSVPVVALDDYFAPEERISVLKIDVEGAELNVFKGAERILAEQSPLLVFECENRHLASGSVDDVFRHLQALGYRGQFIQGRHLRPLTEFDPAVHQKQNGPRFWDAHDYYNNFVFAKDL